MTKRTFTVIVPTLWNFAPFADVCVDVANHPLVLEVIVINNAVERTPENHPLLQHPKIKVHTLKENIYVNPAWNLGAMLSQGEILCIWNDDLIFDLTIFDLIEERLQPSHGVYGLWPSWPNSQVTFHPHSDQGLWGFGQLMFLHRNNWVDIPCELLVYCGDNWIFDTQKNAWQQNFFFSGLLYYTPDGVGGTSSRKFVEWVWREREIYQQLIKEHQLNYTIGFGEGR